MDADARLVWLKKLASGLPGEPSIDISLTWENEHGVAGVESRANEALVFLHNGQQSVESLDEAIALLRAIFADEVVAVTGYERGVPVYTGLGKASDPTVGFNTLDRPLSRDMPRIDDVQTTTWSRGLDE